MKLYTIEEYLSIEDPGLDESRAFTEDEIIDLYWDDWANGEIERLGQENFDIHSTIQQCVEAWCMKNKIKKLEMK